MSTVLITGITGFVGSHLAAELVKKGYDVYGTVRRSASRDPRVLEKYLNDITMLTTDITNYSSVLHTLKSSKPDIVMHTAALTPVRDSFERPFEYEQTNTYGTMNVAHAMLELPDPKTRKLIFASTAEVYGIQEKEPIQEEVSLRPISPYAASKAAADIYVRMMSQTYDLNGVILRPTNTYGRKFDKSFIVEYLVTEMLKGNKVYIGAPDSIRDYMYIDDHVNAYLLAMEKEEAKGNVFNVGTGVGISNRELAEKIADKIGYNKSRISFGKYPPGYPYRPFVSDQPYIVLDSSKIRSTLGWKCTVPLDRGLDKVIDFWS